MIAKEGILMPLIEQTDYDVVLKEDKMEIRSYKGYNIVEISKEIGNGMDSGFNDIFRYISGGNDKSLKISMTAPVLSEMDENSMKTAFVMPRDLSFEDLPQPLDNSLAVRHVSEGIYGVIGFSGLWKQEKFLNMSGHLKLWLESKGYRVISNAIVARYNPPITPPFRRRNEILLKVEKSVK